MTRDQTQSRSPKVFLPDDIMHGLVRKGLRNVEIIRELGEEHGIHGATQSAVSAWKRRHGYTTRQTPPERQKLLPWRVREEHNDRAYRGLYYLGESERGVKLREPGRSALAKFREEMSSNLGLVIHYDRVNGFVKVPRREGIDKGLIREPGIADDGTPIEDRSLWQ